MKFPLTQTLFEEIKTFIWSTMPIDYARLETLVHQAATFLSVWSQDCARVVFFTVLNLVSDCVAMLMEVS